MIALGLLIWTALAVVVGVVLGCVISAADRIEQPAPADTERSWLL